MNRIFLGGAATCCALVAGCHSLDLSALNSVEVTIPEIDFSLRAIATPNVALPPVVYTAMTTPAILPVTSYNGSTAADNLANIIAVMTEEVSVECGIGRHSARCPDARLGALCIFNVRTPSPSPVPLAHPLTAAQMATDEAMTPPAGTTVLPTCGSVSPGLTPSPAAVVFPPTFVNGAAGAPLGPLMTVSFQNAGRVPMTILGVSLTDTSAGYSLPDTPTSTVPAPAGSCALVASGTTRLAAGATCTVRVRFTPLTAGAPTDSVVVTGEFVPPGVTTQQLVSVPVPISGTAVWATGVTGVTETCVGTTHCLMINVNNGSTNGGMLVNSIFAENASGAAQPSGYLTPATSAMFPFWIGEASTTAKTICLAHAPATGDKLLLSDNIDTARASPTLLQVPLRTTCP
ncbi:MAG: hypothetical protein ACHREM_10370 [Polyangiales bacterium]